MNAVPDLLAFAGVMVLAQFSPGPDMVLLTRTSLRRGARAGVEMAIGISCGLMVHAIVAVAGLALAFERLPVLRGIVRWAAVFYLLWLAWGMGVERFVAWYSGGIREVREEAVMKRPFLQGLSCNLLNPKAAIFLAAIAAPFLKGVHPGWWPAALWLIVVGQGMVLWSLWACFLQWKPLRLGYERASPVIDAAFALTLVALAVWLAIR